MITCTKLEFVKTDDDGNKWWKVILTATEEPTKLDLDGTDVDDIASNVRFAAGSVLIAPSSNYIALEDGVFTAKGEGGGGGGGGGTYGVHITNLTAETLDFFLSATVDGDTLETYLVEGDSVLDITVPAGYWLSPDFNTDDTPVVVAGEHEEYDDGDFMFYQINANVDITCGNFG